MKTKSLFNGTSVRVLLRLTVVVSFLLSTNSVYALGFRFFRALRPCSAFDCAPRTPCAAPETVASCNPFWPCDPVVGCADRGADENDGNVELGPRKGGSKGLSPIRRPRDWPSHMYYPPVRFRPHDWYGPWPPSSYQDWRSWVDMLMEAGLRRATSVDGSELVLFDLIGDESAESEETESAEEAIGTVVEETTEI